MIEKLKSHNSNTPLHSKNRSADYRKSSISTQSVGPESVDLEIPGCIFRRICVFAVHSGVIARPVLGPGLRPDDDGQYEHRFDEGASEELGVRVPNPAI